MQLKLCIMNNSQNNLLNDFTAIENVMMPLIINGENLHNAYKNALKILKAVKIFDTCNEYTVESPSQ